VKGAWQGISQNIYIETNIKNRGGGCQKLAKLATDMRGHTTSVGHVSPVEKEKKW